VTVKIPERKPYVVIGAGIHGLSTAYHLAKELKASGKGSGEDVVILEKKGVGAGASGIACGVIRNFYFSPGMHEIMKISIEVFEQDPEGFAYPGSGYVAVVPKQQAGDLVAIHKGHQRIDFPSDLYLGQKECQAHMKTLFPDFHTENIEAILHERKGGFAVPMETLANLERWCEREGVRILSPVKVTGFRMQGETVQAVQTDQGEIGADLVLIGGGPWCGHFWKMLGLPMQIPVKQPDGSSKLEPIATYWKLQEGELDLDRPFLTGDGKIPPTIHLDHDVPLVSDVTGKTITSGQWGIYWKKNATGIQGGSVPINMGTELELEPYGHENPNHIVDESFSDYFTAGLAWAMDRFKGKGKDYKQRPQGGPGCFTPDNYPIIDMVRKNVYLIMDSNHGFKMIGVGKEVAAEVVSGRTSSSLEPFRLSRYDKGSVHPESHSPYPWN
jgi:glycine/D-amino acid oxidase-like deaminating enzyme